MGGYAPQPGQPGMGGYAQQPGQPGPGGYAQQPGQPGPGGYAQQPGQPGSGGYAQTPRGVSQRFESAVLSEDEDKPAGYLFPAMAVRALAEKLQAAVGEVLLERLSSLAVPVGHLGLLLGICSVTLFWIVFAMRLDQLSLFFAALAIPIVGALLQYGTWMFTGVNIQVVKNTPTHASSFALYLFLALGLVFLAAGFIVVGAYSMIRDGTDLGRYAFGGALALSLPLFAIAVALLSPGFVNLRIDNKCTAGADGLSLIGTTLKAGLACARLVFGTLCGLGGLGASIGALWFCFDSTDVRPAAWLSGGATLLFVGGIYQVVVYAITVLYFIIPDLIISVLRYTRERPK